MIFLTLTLCSAYFSTYILIIQAERLIEVNVNLSLYLIGTFSHALYALLIV
jgi:hypothetical protein